MVKIEIEVTEDSDSKGQMLVVKSKSDSVGLATTHECDFSDFFVQNIEGLIKKYGEMTKADQVEITQPFQSVRRIAKDDNG